MAASPLTWTDGAVEAALKIARGFGPVVPLCWPDEQSACACGRGHERHDIGKAPLTPRGFKDASTDPKVITDWWRRWPQANVGLDLERAGLVFVGPDTDGGRAEAAAKGLPPSVVRKSSNDAVLYRRTADTPITSVTAKGEPCGIDVKANGYAVVHGRHKDGSDIYLDPCEAVLAPTPPWANAILRQRKSRSGEPVGERLVEGERHDELVRVTGIFRNSGLTTDEILAALRAINEARCTPRLPDDELRTIAESTTSWYRAPAAAQRLAPCTECAEMRSVTSAQAELMRHPGLTPMQKLVGSAVVYEYASAASRGQLNELGFARISYPAIGERIGVLPNPETGRISSSISNSVRVLVEAGAAKKLTPRSTDPETGQTRSEVWLRLDHTKAADGLRTIAHVERERPRRSRPQSLVCRDHPKARVIVNMICAECGQILGTDTQNKCIDPETTQDWLRSKRHNFGASPDPGSRISATAQSGPSPLDLPPPFEPLDDELNAVDELATRLFVGSRFMADGP